MFQHIVTFLKNYHLKTDFLKQQLDRYIKQFQPKNKWLLTEYIYGIVRHNILINKVIDQHVKKIKRRDRILLQIGVYATFFQHTTKEGVVVNDLIRYIKRYMGGKSGFFNAILRNIVAQREKIFAEIETHPELLYSIPDHFATYLKILPAKWRIKIYQKSIAHPKYYFRVTRKGLGYLQQFESYRYIDDVYRLQGGGVRDIKEALTQGWVQIQDISAQMACHLLNIQKNETVLELCSAPGTKTSLLAEQASVVTAVELNYQKFIQMKQALKSFPNISLLHQDARQPLFIQFDHVLVDPPCSALGTLGKYPEKKYLFDIKNIDCYPAIQLAILENGFNALKVGGTLVYVVCTFTPDETDGVIDAFLRKHHNAIEVDFTMPGTTFKGCRFHSIDHYDGDLFFICKLKKEW